MRGRERCESQREKEKKKKKERKVFFGLVCGSHKKVEIFEWWKLKIVSKQVGYRELGYFKW